MNDKKKWYDFSLERRGLYIRLSVIFSFFFFVPLLGFLYFGFKYDILGDQFIPVFILILLGSSLAGHVLIRKTFDSIRSTSKKISDSLTRDLTGYNRPLVSDELQGILQSFHAVESELRSSFNNVERRTSQLSTLKELSDLCYVTFDSDDLFAITLERALKLTNSDIGSVLILEGQKRDAFVVQATFGLGEHIKTGERVNFATSIAKFAVINKAPLLIDDIEKDSRFGRVNRPHYATKAFLCMPLRGINDVFGVLTLSRGTSDTPFTQEDIDILAPFLSNAAFTYDNLNLMKLNREDRRQLATIASICKTLGSSLLNSELLHAVLSQFREDVPFNVAVVMEIQEQNPDHVVVLDILSSIPLGIIRGGSYDYTGSLLEGVIRQGNLLLIDNPENLRHPLEMELFVKTAILSTLLVPLKMGGVVTGLLVIGDVRPGAFNSLEEKADNIASLLALAMEKTRLSTSVTKRDQEMESIKQIGSILAASTFDRQEVLKHTMDMIRTIMNVEAGSLLLIEDGELAFKVAFNSNPEINIGALNTLRVQLGQGIAGYSAARGESVIVCDTRDSRQFAPDFDRQTGFQTRSILCVPLISRGRVLGVIEVINKLNGTFNNDDLQLLQSIATSVSIALENSQLYQETLSMAEQERGIRNMFQKFVPREIVDKITHNTETEKTLLEELKILTLLNIDIRGFSTLSKKIGPQRTVAMLNHFFATMGDIVFKHQGIVDKYLGDGFLALFGAPVSSATDADNAIAAALEMKASLAHVNDHFAEDLEEPLSMGISIHTGEAVIGNIGFEKKMDYTVIGDSVNAVFRLQDLTKSRPNSILISEKTRFAAMNSILDVQDIGMCDAGSTLGELKIYELVGSHPRGGNGARKDTEPPAAFPPV
ncbi:MAG: GAF domain-containing protein [Syntrophales bacterium]|nr:GAF domain-containing protein [Syntrophales bacterium]